MSVPLKQEQDCPVCGLVVAGDMNIDGSGEPPSAGDVGVCVNCGVILEFVEQDGQLVRQIAPHSLDEPLPEHESLPIAKVTRFLMKRRNVGRWLT